MIRLTTVAALHHTQNLRGPGRDTEDNAYGYCYADFQQGFSDSDVFASILNSITTMLNVTVLLVHDCVVLAQRGYFKEKEFINYLDYLQYWKKQEYAQYLK